MDVTIAGDAIARPYDDDQLGRITIELSAFDGEVGQSAFPIDDPTAIDEYVSGRRLLCQEAGVYVLDGFILLRDQSRGPVKVVDREVLYTVEDANALLYAKRFVQNRPAETDVARVLAMAALQLSGVDTTWVLNSNTVTMEKKRYETEGWGEFIDDLVNLTGKTLFIHDKAGGGRCLHYHRLNTGHTSGLTISDVPTAVNGTTVFAPGNPVRTPTGVDLANDVIVIDQASRRAFLQDATSITAHDADGLSHQRFLTVEAGSQTEVNTIAANMLAELKDERTTYECTIGPLDVGALAKIRVGDFITVTSQAMGLTASSQRIAHMTLTPFSGLGGKPMGGYWDAHLELGYPLRLGTSRFRGAIPGNPKPVPPPQDPDTGDPDGVGCGFDFTTALGGFVVYEEDSDGTIAAGGSALEVTPPSSGGDVASYALRTVLTGQCEVLANITIPDSSPGDNHGIEIGFFDQTLFDLYVGGNVRVDGPQGTLTVFDASDTAMGANGPSSSGTGSGMDPDIAQGSSVWMRISYSPGSITARVWPVGGDEFTDGFGAADSATIGVVTGVYINGHSTATNTGLQSWNINSLEITIGCSATPVGFKGGMYGPVRIGTGDGSTVDFTLPSDADDAALMIAVNGVILTPGRYTFDHATHVVSLAVAPLAGAIVTATYRIPS